MRATSVDGELILIFSIRAPATANSNYEFSSKSKRGAVAILKDGGMGYKVSRSKAFQDYIQAHHMAWYEFATSRCHLDLRVQDLVLVSGFVKTNEWTLTAYNRRKTTHDLSFKVDTAGVTVVNADAGVSFNDSANDSPLHRSGPQHTAKTSGSKDSPLTKQNSPHPVNQCVFLQYYKCKPRAFGSTTLKKPQNLKESDVLDNVSDECFCTPLDSLVGWAKERFDSRKDVEGDSEQVQERVSSYSTNIGSITYLFLVNRRTNGCCPGLYLEGEPIFSPSLKRIR